MTLPWGMPLLSAGEQGEMSHRVKTWTWKGGTKGQVQALVRVARGQALAHRQGLGLGLGLGLGQVALALSLALVAVLVPALVEVGQGVLPRGHPLPLLSSLKFLWGIPPPSLELPCPLTARVSSVVLWTGPFDCGDLMDGRLV